MYFVETSIWRGEVRKNPGLFYMGSDGRTGQSQWKVATKGMLPLSKSEKALGSRMVRPAGRGK